jgi:hypothetical protein
VTRQPVPPDFSPISGEEADRPLIWEAVDMEGEPHVHAELASGR